MPVGQGIVASISFRPAEPWIEDDAPNRNSMRKLASGDTIAVPDAPGSKNIRVVVNEKVGSTRCAGLAFAAGCTVSIAKDGVVEVDKEGVRAKDGFGGVYVSRKMQWEGTRAIVMVAATSASSVK